MNLAEWLQGDHEPSQRLKAVQSLCRAVTERGPALSLDPARIQVAASGECRPEEGKGTPQGRYRPPEIIEGRPATPQSPVYTAGVLCFEILGGRPFEARGGPLLRDVRPDLPRDLCDAVQACLEMDAEWRPKDLSYVLGLMDAMGRPAAPASGPPGRGGRAAGVPAAPPSPSSRRPAPAPRPWPLLVFALVALAASLASAVVRLRQPIAPPSLPPAASAAPLASPRAPAADREGATAAALPRAAPTGAAPEAGRVAVSIASPRPAGAGSSPTTGAPQGPRAGTAVTTSKRAASASAAAPSPLATTSGTVAPPTVAPPASPTPPPAAEPAGPAAVTSVSPPLWRRGATALVDVHGVNLRRDHQVRIARGREAARGVEVVRQRYVGPALLQVLLRIDASAPAGGYVLTLVDGSGGATNPRPIEVAK